MNPVALVSQLAAADIGVADRAALDEVLTTCRSVRGWLDGILSQVAARADALHAQGRGRETEDVMQRTGGMSKREARDVVHRRKVTEASRPMAEGLSSGALTGAHVDAFGRAVALAPAVADHAADLVRVGAMTSPAEFEQHCKRLAAVLAPDDGLETFERQRRQTKLKRWIDEATGMYKLYGEWDPESGEKLWRAINRQVEAMFHDKHPDTAPADPGDRNDHFAALALVELATGGVSGAADSAPRTTTADISVLIDLETIINGTHSGSTVDMSTGGKVPVSVIRKWACDANIIPIVLNGDGVVLDVGRDQRLATRWQRRALRAMYSTCIVDGCSVPFDHCSVHHFDHWGRDSGRTDLSVLGPACSKHHDLFHHGGWKVRSSPDGIIIVTLPDGTEFRTYPRRAKRSGGGRNARAPAGPQPEAL
jgi:hypothetical protein